MPTNKKTAVTPTTKKKVVASTTKKHTPSTTARKAGTATKKRSTSRSHTSARSAYKRGQFNHNQGERHIRTPFRQFIQKAAPIEEAHIRVVPLGGLEEVGRNMCYFEYVDPSSEHNGEILVVDMGLQFPEENMPGIDYIIPQISSLLEKKDKIVGIVITHGHYDHLGGIPHIMPVLGLDLPIYGTDLTLALIKKRQTDFNNGRDVLNLKEINNDTKLQLGVYALKFFGVSHNIPASVGLVATTPIGGIVHTGDFKIDVKSDIAGKTEVDKIKALSKENILLLMSDSTNASQVGKQHSELEITTEMKDIIRDATGRLIIGTFASLLGRLNEIIGLAVECNKKIIIEGRSMKNNVAIATELGYIKGTENTIIPIEDMDKHPKENIIILATGAQGEDNAVLMRIVNKRHRFLKIEPGDTVVFSSSVIPGNERSVQALTDKLYRDGADVINYRMLDVHAGGHAKQEDLKDFMKMVKPRYFMPIEGNHSFLRIHAKLAREVGFEDDHIIVADNGQVVVATKDKAILTDEYVPANYVMVDGLGVGDVQEVVLRDRQAMASDGVFMVVVVVDGATGKIIGSPDIISRGFVYLRESRELMQETRRRIRRTVETVTKEMHPINFAHVKDRLRDDIGQFLFQRTERRPMILPVIIEV